MRKNRVGAVDGLLWQLMMVGLVVFALYVWRDPGLLRSNGIGQKMASWQVQPLTGATHGHSSEELAGQVVLLNFWGTWCGPCRQEFPHIAQLSRRFSQIPNVAIVAVSCGPGNDGDIESLRMRTQAYLNETGAKLPTYADCGGSARASVPGMRGYPCTVVLDGDGVIRGMWSGYRPGCEVEMEQLIADLLCSRSKNN